MLMYVSVRHRFGVLLQSSVYYGVVVASTCVISWSF